MYLSIATRGYFSNQSYAFLPGYPLFGRLFSLLTGDPVVALALTSIVFGLFWIPLYQAVAEARVDKRSALISTVLFTFFPGTFLFSTVAYSEGLFLFMTLGAWYCIEKEKLPLASLFATAATIVRWPGA